MSDLDRYFKHPAHPSLGNRAVVERRLTSGELTYVTYEWNPDLPIDVQRKLVAQKLVNDQT